MRLNRVLPLASLVCVVALSSASATVRAGDPSEQTVGKPVKTFETTAVRGLPKTRFPIQKLAGRVILLEFYSARSERESDAVPHLNKLHDQLGPKGLTVLGVCAAETEFTRAWEAEYKVAYATCNVDAEKYDALISYYQYPGMPWSYLVDVTGTIVWQGHPQALKAPTIESYLKPVSAPPRLPEELADAQKLLDQGRWAAARTLLTERAAAETDKRIQSWARMTAAWVEQRSKAVFDDAKALEEKGWWWDAWQIYDDFATRFEGMEGVEKAAELAAAVRANAEAKADLELGDRVAKAGELMHSGEEKKAKLIITNILKRNKGNRHGDRCELILHPIE